MLTYVTSRLLAKVLLIGFHEMEIILLPPDLWLITVLWLTGSWPPSWSCAQQFPSLWMPLEAPDWQLICNRHQRETVSFFGYRHLTPIFSMLGCNAWCHGEGLMCTISHSQAMCTSKLEWSSYHQSAYLVFGNTFVQSEGFGCSQINCYVSGSVFFCIKLYSWRVVSALFIHKVWK